MPPRISIRGSVRLSIHPSVMRFFSNSQKRLFLAAEMDGIELVVMRGEAGGGTAVTEGD